MIGKRILRTEVEYIPAKLKVKQIVQQVDTTYHIVDSNHIQTCSIKIGCNRIGMPPSTHVAVLTLLSFPLVDTIRLPTSDCVAFFIFIIVAADVLAAFRFADENFLFTVFIENLHHLIFNSLNQILYIVLWYFGRSSNSKTGCFFEHPPS